MLPLLGAVLALVVLASVGFLLYRRRDLGTSAERVTFQTLHTASLAAPDEGVPWEEVLAKALARGRA